MNNGNGKGSKPGLTLSCVLQTTLQQLSVKGGLTESVFPEAEKYLFNNDQLQEALHDVAKQFNKDMKRYHSLIDFLLVELFPKLWPTCERFYLYEGTAPTLKDMLDESPGLQEWYNMVLLKALEIILQTHLEEHLLKTWDQLQKEAVGAMPSYIKVEA